ncbi:MAG: FAD-dependent monooxygenase [Pseudomonadota bacterium]
MQYHLNGFRPGNPEVHPAARARPDAPPKTLDAPPETPDVLPDTLDVLIVGCGPAGLTLAAYLAGFPQISTRIVERKPGPLEKGQADGISCRSMEMFAAFGFADTVIRQGYQVSETTFWAPDPANPAHIARQGRVDDVEEGLSEMPHMILNQARVHDLYLDVMRNAPSRLVPDYGLELAGLTIDPGAAYPVTAMLRDTDTGEIRTCRARYVVGCDGARSAVREAIGLRLEGSSANQAWGVMDILAVTDFPDIRLKTLIKSARDGNVIIIPREGGYLVRLYIEMDQLREGERVSSRAITSETLIAAAQRIFHPFSLDVREVVWWSVYEIGQRLAARFDDLPEAQSATGLPHVFIAGDACHTHSPKAGQGMNVSMGDAFNLGWKLAAVLTGRAPPDLLRSYSAERQAVAADLIAFDRDWARIMSARPGALPAAQSAATADDGEDADFQRHFIAHGRYTAGMSVRYAPSSLIGTARWQALAPGFPIGARFHSAPVVRLSDARPVQLGQIVQADARWRLIAFCPAQEPGPSSAIAELCAFLATSRASPCRRHTPKDADPDAVIDLRAVFPQNRRDLALEAMPPALLPRKGRFGLIDYEKIFCADPSPGRNIYDLRGIDRAQGCLLVLRPDQYVAHLLPLHETGALSDFFAGILTEV